MVESALCIQIIFFHSFFFFLYVFYHNKYCPSLKYYLKYLSLNRGESWTRCEHSVYVDIVFLSFYMPLPKVNIIPWIHSSVHIAKVLIIIFYDFVFFQAKAKKPLFVQFVLENIWALYDTVIVRK